MKLQDVGRKATHCRELERAKQLCADRSTASGGGYRLAPPRIVQGFRIEAVKHRVEHQFWFLLRRYAACSSGRDRRTGRDGEKLLEKARQRRQSVS